MADMPCICVPITIDATNNKLDFKIGVTTYVATLTSATYNDIFLFADEVQSSMRTATSGFQDVDVLTSSGSVGHIFIDLDGAGELLWSSGANSANTCGALLGFDTSADDTGSTFTSDYQAPNAWYSINGPLKDTYENLEFVGGEGRRSLTGTKFKRLSVATRAERHIDIGLQTAANTYEDQATGSDTNRAFETIWKQIVGDDEATLRYFPDYTDSGTYGTYYLKEPKQWIGQVERPTKGVRRHSWQLVLLKQES